MSLVGKLRNPWAKARFLWVIVWVYIAWSLVPLLIAIRISFNRGRSLVDFQGWSFIWWWSHPTLSAWHRPELHTALLQSVKLATVTMLIAVPLGVSFALALDRWRGPLPASAGFLMALSWVTPELTIGVALFLVFAHLLTFVHLGTWAQALGLITFEMTYPVIIVRARLLSIPMSYEEAGMDLGASPTQAVRRVLLPLLYPAIFASVALVFADSIDDFVTVRYLCASQSCQTLSMIIYGSSRGSPTPATNAAATLMLISTLTAITVAVMIFRFLTRGQRSKDQSGVREFVSIEV